MDPDCIDCSRPTIQMCADGYAMTEHRWKYGCTRITCTPPTHNNPGHNPRKCLENNGRGYRQDRDCIDCSKPPRQACADGYRLISKPWLWGCTRIECFKQ